MPLPQFPLPTCEIAHGFVGLPGDKSLFVEVVNAVGEGEGQGNFVLQMLVKTSAGELLQRD